MLANLSLRGSREIRKISTARAASFDIALDDVSITSLTFGRGKAKSAQLIGQAIANNPPFFTLRIIEASREIAHVLASSSNKVYLNLDELLLNLQDSKYAGSGNK
ncbi:hypothetical protein OROHE_001925 [Orobanche hederae]